MRLGAEALETPAPGIDARERGMLLHKALELVWMQARQSFRAFGDRDADRCARRSRIRWRPPWYPYFAATCRSSCGRRSSARRYRLELLIEKLLDVERTRAPFTIETLEARREVSIAGGQFELRIDRIDAIEGGGYAILDYKSGEPRALRWNGEAVRDPQLLAYLMAERGRDVAGAGQRVAGTTAARNSPARARTTGCCRTSAACRA